MRMREQAVDLGGEPTTGKEGRDTEEPSWGALMKGLLLWVPWGPPGVRKLESLTLVEVEWVAVISSTGSSPLPKEQGLTRESQVLAERWCHRQSVNQGDRGRCQWGLPLWVCILYRNFWSFPGTTCPPPQLQFTKVKPYKPCFADLSPPICVQPTGTLGQRAPSEN